jgi:hypothetical protein
MESKKNWQAVGVAVIHSFYVHRANNAKAVVCVSARCAGPVPSAATERSINFIPVSQLVLAEL